MPLVKYLYAIIAIIGAFKVNTLNNI
jgi:hypothetical protein